MLKLTKKHSELNVGYNRAFGSIVRVNISLFCKCLILLDEEDRRRDYKLNWFWPLAYPNSSLRIQKYDIHVLLLYSIRFQCWTDHLLFSTHLFFPRTSTLPSSFYPFSLKTSFSNKPTCYFTHLDYTHFIFCPMFNKTAVTCLSGAYGHISVFL